MTTRIFSIYSKFYPSYWHSWSHFWCLTHSVKTLKNYYLVKWNGLIQYPDSRASLLRRSSSVQGDFWTPWAGSRSGISVQQLHASNPPTNSSRQNLAVCLGKFEKSSSNIERELLRIQDCGQFLGICLAQLQGVKLYPAIGILLISSSCTLGGLLDYITRVITSLSDTWNEGFGYPLRDLWVSCKIS